MPKNEDGEFELILGNRQLLSVFFIVVILLGVFFTMGYIVGRNSGPTTEAVRTRPESAAPAAESAAKSEEAPKAAEPAPVAAAPVEEKAPEPAKAEAKPEPARAEKAEAKSEAKTEAKEAKETKKEKSAKSKAAAASSEPAAGQTYLQLAATTKHEADIMVDVLRNKGFKSIAAEIEEKRGTFRVLVGPIPEGAANKTRADLQASGFPGNAAIRRTF